MTTESEYPTIDRELFDRIIQQYLTEEPCGNECPHCKVKWLMASNPVVMKTAAAVTTIALSNPLDPDPIFNFITAMFMAGVLYQTTKQMEETFK